MSITYYTGEGVEAPTTSPSLPAPSYGRGLSDPRNYIAERGAVDAVNTAIVLGQPLLLTGEPGCGKTELASSIAHELGLPLLRFDTKSTTQARDLFYFYDAIARLHAAQSGAEGSSALDHLQLHALGLAILLTLPPGEAAELVPRGVSHREPVRSVVLIDEIDKAPRDVPNDVLSEIEEFRFRIPELGYRLVEGSPERRPIVVLTSNSEKALPDTFLRRCLYYNLPLPEGERLRRILELRLGEAVGSTPFLNDVLEVYEALRAGAQDFGRPPSTAELLRWILALRSFAPEDPNPLRSQPELIHRTLGVLVKTEVDQAQAREVVEQWTGKRLS